jgi:hypothetical protein
MNEGWSEVGISGGSHLERMVEMYQELGFEVRLEQITPGDQECARCYEETGETPYRVYVRSKEDAGETAEGGER